MLVENIVKKIETDLNNLDKKSEKELFELMQPLDSAVYNYAQSLKDWIKSNGKSEHEYNKTITYP